MTLLLAGIKPSEMGIPHGPMSSNNNLQRMRSEEMPIKGLNDQQNDFQSFENTFKSVKKPGTKMGNEQQENTAPAQSYEEKPIRDMKEAPPIEQPVNNFEDQPLPTTKKSLAEIPEDRPINQSAAKTAPANPENPNMVNIDEIQIKPKQQLTFEEMLEKELNEKQDKPDPIDDNRVIRKKPKREFLKRTTKKAKVPKGKKIQLKFRIKFQEV